MLHVRIMIVGCNDRGTVHLLGISPPGLQIFVLGNGTARGVKELEETPTSSPKTGFLVGSRIWDGMARDWPWALDSMSYGNPHAAIGMTTRLPTPSPPLLWTQPTPMVHGALA